MKELGMHMPNEAIKQFVLYYQQKYGLTGHRRGQPPFNKP